MTKLNDIQSEIAALPPNLRAEVLDFVRFVKQRHGLPAALAPVASAPDKGDSAFFQAWRQRASSALSRPMSSFPPRTRTGSTFRPRAGSSHDSGGYGRMAGLGRSR